MIRTLRTATLALLATCALAACQKERVCPAGEAACGIQCVPLATDARNCGACGNACGAAEVCQASQCACAPGTTRCGDACVSLGDAAHCGACDVACTGADVCAEVGGAPACVPDCQAGQTLCDRSCVDLQASRLHCGACGHACQPGAACDAGACRSVQVACFATDDVRAVAPDLATTGGPRAAGDGPISLAALGADVWAVASLSGSLIRQPLDLAADPVEYALHGNDFEYVAVHQGRLYVSNSTAGSIVVADPATGQPLDEITFPGEVSPYPHGLAFVGGRAYVALYGKDEASGGQSVAVLDLAPPGACATAGTRCATVAATIDLRAAADAPGLPFPSRAVAVGSKVYVTVSNLKKDEDPSSFTFGYYVLPAGHGKLAVLDTAAGDALSILDLGAACGNPGSLAAQGSTLWVACAAFGAAGLLPVDLTGAPAVGAMVETTLGAPGNVAFCGGVGFVTDQWSGDVLRFDPAGVASPATQTICPNGPQGWAWAADVLCATGP